MRNLILGTIALLSVLLCGLSPAQDSQTWPRDLTPGAFEVFDSGELRFEIGERDGPLPLRVRAPVPTAEEPGPFPLVIFSHGMGGGLDAFEHLSQHLASHGYVVIHPQHADSIALQRERGVSRDEIRRMFSQGGTSRVSIRGRVDDCLWIVDAIKKIEQEAGIEGRTDTSRAVAAGHSAGAMTAQALAGLKFAPKRTRRSIAMDDDGRFDAFVIVSGQGLNTPSLREDSWEDFDRPTLVFAGSEDTSRVSAETPESRRHPYEKAPAGDKFLVYIDGATHSSYQGKESPNADEKRIEALTSHATLAFLDGYIRGNEAALAWLKESAPGKFAGVEAEYRSK